MPTQALEKILTGNADLDRLQDAWLAVLNPFLKSKLAGKVTWHKVGDPGDPVSAQTSFQNGWVNFDASTVTNPRLVAFSKDSLGIVRIRGVVKSGTVSTTIFSPLPPGFRPGINMTFSCDNNGFGSIRVTTAGGVIQSTEVSPSNSFQFLDGIQFVAEN